MVPGWFQTKHDQNLPNEWLWLLALSDKLVQVCASSLIQLQIYLLEAQQLQEPTLEKYSTHTYIIYHNII